MDVRELLIKSLEGAEFDIYNASEVADVGTLRRKAMADIHGGQEATYLTQEQAAEWQGRIEKVATFRRASLGWREPG